MHIDFVMCKNTFRVQLTTLEQIEYLKYSELTKKAHAITVI